MVEILRSNDPIRVSFAASLLEDAGIPHTVADSHMSVIDGSLPVVETRVLVAEDSLDEARELLTDANVLST